MSALCRPVSFFRHVYFNQLGHFEPFDALGSKEPPIVNLSLYLIADRPSIKDENRFFFNVEAAVVGGVTCVQLRDFESDFETIVMTAKRLKKMLNNHGVPLMINTSHLIKVVQAVECDGIYLEQQFSSSQIRQLFGRTMILGMPVKTMDDVLAAEQNSDIDYISVKIYPSKHTNPKEVQVWGIPGLEKVCSVSKHRIVAVGGITLDNAASVYRLVGPHGGSGLAGNLLKGDNPRAMAEQMQAIRLQSQILERE